MLKKQIWKQIYTFYDFTILRYTQIKKGYENLYYNLQGLTYQEIFTCPTSEISHFFSIQIISMT